MWSKKSSYVILEVGGKDHNVLSSLYKQNTVNVLQVFWGWKTEQSYFSYFYSKMFGLLFGHQLSHKWYLAFLSATFFTVLVVALHLWVYGFLKFCNKYLCRIFSLKFGLECKSWSKAPNHCWLLWLQCYFWEADQALGSSSN